MEDMAEAGVLGRKRMDDMAEAGEEAPSLHYRGYLPHWERMGAVYFITFRLIDALPQQVLASYEAERQAVLTKVQAAGKVMSIEEQARLDRLFSTRVQRYLDKGVGACYLAMPAIAEIVAQALRYFHGTRYHLFAWCIMPNHVHVVMEPLPPHSLASILHSWKSFTANRAHRVLGLRGAFWQREYYDHVIRDEQAFWRLIAYVVQNPIKANLPDWRWVEVSVPSEPIGV